MTPYPFSPPPHISLSLLQQKLAEFPFFYQTTTPNATKLPIPSLFTEYLSKHPTHYIPESLHHTATQAYKFLFYDFINTQRIVKNAEKRMRDAWRDLEEKLANTNNEDESELASPMPESQKRTTANKELLMELWVRMQSIQLDLWIFEWLGGNYPEDMHQEFHTTSSQNSSVVTAPISPPITPLPYMAFPSGSITRQVNATISPQSSISVCIIPIYHASQTPLDSTYRIPPVTCGLCLRCVDIVQGQIRSETARDTYLKFDEGTLVWKEWAEGNHNPQMALFDPSLSLHHNLRLTFWRKPQNQLEEIRACTLPNNNLLDGIARNSPKESKRLVGLVRGFLSGAYLSSRYALSLFAHQSPNLHTQVNHIATELAHLKCPNLVFFPHSLTEQEIYDSCAALVELDLKGIRVHVAYWRSMDHEEEEFPLPPLIEADKIQMMRYMSLVQFVECHCHHIVLSMVSTAKLNAPKFYAWSQKKGVVERAHRIRDTLRDREMQSRFGEWNEGYVDAMDVDEDEQVEQKKNSLLESTQRSWNHKVCPVPMFFEPSTLDVIKNCEMMHPSLHSCVVCDETYFNEQTLQKHEETKEHQERVHELRSNHYYDCFCGRTFPSLPEQRAHCEQCDVARPLLRIEASSPSRTPSNNVSQNPMRHRFRQDPVPVPPENRNLVYTPQAVEALIREYGTDMIESANDIVQLVETVLKRRYKSDLLEPVSSELRKSGTVLCHVVTLTSSPFLHEGKEMTLKALGRGNNLSLAKKAAAINLLSEMQQLDMIGEDIDPTSAEIMIGVSKSLREGQWGGRIHTNLL